MSRAQKIIENFTCKIIIAFWNVLIYWATLLIVFPFLIVKSYILTDRMKLKGLWFGIIKII